MALILTVAWIQAIAPCEEPHGSQWWCIQLG